MKKLLVGLLVASIAHAQPADVPGMIKFAEAAPADMDKAVWKEKRRDVVKKLGQSKDKHATPVLTAIAESETFDIVGEIAIEALGQLGDQAAVPTLQKIYADQGRDKHQRDLAKKALQKLGAPLEAKAAPTPTPTPPPVPLDVIPPTPPPATPTPPPADPTPTDLLSSGGGRRDPGAPPTAQPAGPVASVEGVPDDALAAYDRLTFAGGSAHLGYDNVRKETDFDADISGAYAHRVELPGMAYGWGANAHVVAGYINPDGDAQHRGAQLTADANGEVRFYGGMFYGVGKVVGALQYNYFADTADNGTAFKDTAFAGDIQLALGGGYGRQLDVGAAIRVRRLSRALDANRALGKPIDAATARKLELTWWSLRGERTTYRALVETVRILREVGILLSEPDAGLSYEILNVLRDSNLYLRPSGIDVQLTFGEGYLQRPDMPAPTESGRVEQVLFSAGYAQQLDDDKLELAGSAYARYRLFAPENTPSPWGIGATGSVRRFSYGEHGDPLGMLDGSVTVEASSDDTMNSDTGLRITASVGWTWWINQAGGLRLAGNLTEDTGAVIFGLSIQGTYALLDGTFAGL